MLRKKQGPPQEEKTSNYRGIITKNRLQDSRWDWAVQEYRVRFAGEYWETIKSSWTWDEEEAERQLTDALRVARASENYGERVF